MHDHDKTREQLITEFSELRQRFVQKDNSRFIQDDTNNNEVEAAAYSMEERYELAFRCSPDPITITTLGGGRYVDVNNAFLEASGYERHGVIGRTAMELDIWISHQERDLFIQQLRERNYFVRNSEISLRTKSGAVKTFIYSTEIININGKPHLLWVTKDISTRKSYEEALRLAQDKFTKAFVFSPDPIIMSTLREGRYVEANDAWVELMGYQRHEAIGRTAGDLDIWVDEERELVIKQVREQGSVKSRETRFRTKSGDIRFCLFSAEIIETDGVEYLLSVTKDISERKQMEEALRLSEDKFSKAFNSSSAGMSITTLKEGRFIAINDRSSGILGFEQEEVLGRTSLEIGFWVDPAIRCSVIEKITRRESVRDLEICFRRKSGEQRFGSYSVEGIEINGELCMLNILADISDRKKAEAEINYLSFHDKLTGLYNRAYFEEELKRMNTKIHLPISIIIGDVNGLKLINDALGHQEGDKLLITVADVLRQSCRAEDTIARWGGDEFIILLPNCENGTAVGMVERIQTGCQHFNELPIKTSLSLGLATKMFVAEDIREIIKEAEDKMYRNKLLEDKSTRSSFLVSLQQTLWSRSHETEEHCIRLHDMVQEIGHAIGLPQSELDNLRLLSLLHDIGKIAIPNNILDKPGKLSTEEWETIKKHPEIGYRIALSSPEMAPIAEAILHHHERWDGTGYPLGIKGEEIPLISRILAIADAYDVMIYGRPYQRAIAEAEVWAEITHCAGSQFDPDLVRETIELFDNNYANKKN